MLHLVAGKSALWLVPVLCSGRPMMLLERLAAQRNERVRQRYLAALGWLWGLARHRACVCIVSESARLPRRSYVVAAEGAL